MVYLESKRLLFRSHEPSDEAEFVAMHTDPEVRRYVGGRAWAIDEAIRRFRNGYLGQPETTYGLWATILKETRQYIGACGLSLPPDRQTPNLAYYIACPFWGRGFASEASRAFLEDAFSRMNLPRVLADVEKGHNASEHILRKLGFNFVSEEQVHNSTRIIATYELTMDAWEQGHR